MEKEEAQTKQLETIEKDFKAKIAQLQEAFKVEEKKWNKKERTYQIEKDRVCEA
jgi:hypothetical protein